MKKLFILSLLLGILGGCNDRSAALVDYVDPFIGTGGHGHTFPGAVVPHGMVQLSPDTRMEGWDACSGYHYSDSVIIGFTHTHLSGTGIGDYGDILLMPVVGSVSLDCGADSIAAYRSRFSHERESAVPGYYSVVLDDYGVRAELTATTRAGMHRYTFPAADSAAVVVDLAHTLQFHENLDLELRVLSPTEIEGVKRTCGWAKDQPVYFYAVFSQPFEAQLFAEGAPVAGDSVSGQGVKALLTFGNKGGEVLAKVGISAVDCRGARGNVEAEIPDWDFGRVVAEASDCWEKCLDAIEVTSSDEVSKKIFYTGLYHAMISPNTYVDVDGRYRGQDHRIHTSETGEYYTVFSLWDTFRALHPLLNIINPTLNESFVRTLIAKSDEGGFLPMWDLASNYTGTMIGYHAVSVIVEAYLKGLRGFDAEKAFEACVKSSQYHPVTIENMDGEINTGSLMPIGKLYKDSIGWVPCNRDNESVAKGLEYAYNDWCIAQFAKALGKEKEYEEFSKKAAYYKNYFDPSVGFMRGKRLDGSWNSPFDPRASNHRKDDYCEGNAWQWSWYVMHDVPGLIALHGGPKGFSTKLDSLFTVSSELAGNQVSSDISGLIGQYAHGNEPSHHITHLYNYVGESWKTQQLVDSILFNLYFADPNGLAGNEDCGQMSAWYLLNAMGFYSVAPASGVYTLGRPIFDRVRIQLPERRSFEIVTRNNSRENKYIQQVTWNGKPMNTPFFTHQALMQGGVMEIEMGPEPNKDFRGDPIPAQAL